MDEKALTPLTNKQKAFCCEYIKDWNGTRAAIAAGYSEITAAVIACENLIKPNIQAYIKEIQADIEKQVGISKAMVLNEHKKIAFSSIANLHDTWVDRKVFENLTEEQKACISEIQTRVRRVPISVIDPDSEKLVETDCEIEEIKIKLYDKQKSLDSISKHLGYFAPEKVDHTSKGDKIEIIRTIIGT